MTDTANTQTTRTPAQIFALAISSGQYNEREFMCTALDRMCTSDSMLTYSEHTQAKQAIISFINDWHTMRAYLAYYFKCDPAKARKLALAIYSDWDNRYSILAAPFEHDTRHIVMESYDE